MTTPPATQDLDDATDPPGPRAAAAGPERTTVIDATSTTAPSDASPSADTSPDTTRSTGTTPSTDTSPSTSPDTTPGTVPAPRRPLRRRAARVLDVLALVVVAVALLVPDKVEGVGLHALLRLPIEAIVLGAAVLVLRGRLRRVVVVGGGVLAGVMLIVRLLDMGFNAVLVRPFDPVLDWTLVRDGIELVGTTSGQAGQVGVIVGAVLLTVVLVALVTRAFIRSAGLLARRPRVTARVVLALTVVWLAAAGVGLRAPDVDTFAARVVAGSLNNHLQAGLGSYEARRTFAARAADDAFAAVPGDQLLRGLEGKDVVFAIIESYGRSAVQDPRISPQVSPVLARHQQQLAAKGFTGRSAFLTSSTAGGGSWFAHSTLLSGMWTTNDATYQPLITSNRLTLNTAFKKAGWDTAAVMPAVTRTWREASFYKYGTVLDLANLRYSGPGFAWSPMPDQFALKQLQDRLLSRPDRKPAMIETALTSSHYPWTRVPKMVGWDAMGDGSVFAPLAADRRTMDQTLSNGDVARTGYSEAIAYSLDALLSWVERYGTSDTVVVFLGDHQPIPLVTGQKATRDVPISVLAKDPKVLDRISGWGWEAGLHPSPQAPVWRMDSFRDRFLTAYAK